jgi:ABC-type uncharacterized transport system auxiliary subunit
VGGGCLSKPSLVKQSFSFVVAPGPALSSKPVGRVLAIRRVIINAPFDSQSLIYRTGADSFETDPYAQFLVPPAEILSAALQGYFRQTGVFSDVSIPGSLLPADMFLEVTVDQLYGDFRNPAEPAAVLEVQFVFFGARAQGDSTSSSIVLKKEYKRRITLSARTAAALVTGWNQALKEVGFAAATELNGTAGTAAAAAGAFWK